MTDEQCSIISDAIRSISLAAEELRASHTSFTDSNDWGDDIEAQADYDADMALIARLNTLIDEPASNSLTYPKDLSDDLREVLGWPCFKCAPIAHAMRAGGDNIKPKAEDEQAVVLHWLVTLVLTHGDGWRAQAQKEIVLLRDAAIAKEPRNEA
jgi:hypothetical protein